MPQRSTRHSPRIDDEMAAETEALTRGAPVPAHAEEWRQPEPAADDEPEPESVVEFVGDWRGLQAASEASERPREEAEASRSASDASPTGKHGMLDDNERRRRSELAAALPGHAFPGDRGRLLHAAEAEHAPEWVIEALATLPIDTRFDTPQDVWSALGGHREARTGEHPVVEAPVPSVELEPEPEPPHPPHPSPPPGLDLVARVAGIAGLGVEVASAVIGGTVHLVRRVIGWPLRR